MEFYLYNKDDRKLKTLVNLATTFKIGETNYIVYYNTQTEKSVIDIYIGKIGYDDECLAINKVDFEKQGQFLATIKDILASKNPETDDSDYQNIIDTATIVLEEVQKIQIPTSSLEMLLNYKKNNEPSIEDIVPETNTDINSGKSNEGNTTTQIDNNAPSEIVNDNLNNNNMASDNNVNIIPNDNVVSQKQDNQINHNVVDNNYINGNDKLNDLDNLINVQQDKKNKPKKEKQISTPILVMLVLVVIIAIALLVIENMM